MASRMASPTLRDAFFQSPDLFAADGGADGMLRHLSADLAQAMDARLVPDLRNFLFDPPVAIDLAAINIQRGRDLGLPRLNEMREALHLDPYHDFGEITDDAGTVAALREAFGSVDMIDLWTGGLSEAVRPGRLRRRDLRRDHRRPIRPAARRRPAVVGEPGFSTRATMDEIRHTTLSDLILRNTDTQYLQDDVFIFYERRAGGDGGDGPRPAAAADPGGYRPGVMPAGARGAPPAPLQTIRTDRSGSPAIRQSSTSPRTTGPTFSGVPE